MSYVQENYLQLLSLDLAAVFLVESLVRGTFVMAKKISPVVYGAVYNGLSQFLNGYAYVARLYALTCLSLPITIMLNAMLLSYLAYGIVCVGIPRHATRFLLKSRKLHAAKFLHGLIDKTLYIPAKQLKDIVKKQQTPPPASVVTPKTASPSFRFSTILAEGIGLYLVVRTMIKRFRSYGGQKEVPEGNFTETTEKSTARLWLGQYPDWILTTSAFLAGPFFVTLLFSKRGTSLTNVGKVLSHSSRYLFLYTAIWGPLIEEIIFRFMFDRLQRGVGGKTKPKESTSRIRRYPAWVLTSSLLFAGAHISNWGFAESKSPLVERFQGSRLTDNQKVMGAVGQYAGSLFMSLEVLSPLYLQAGLAASFGAHLLWNTYGVVMLFSPFILELFLVRRLLRSFRRVKEDKT
jgi:membrane protease YdiL (CAAX protease family)